MHRATPPGIVADFSPQLTTHDLKSGADQWRWDLGDDSVGSEGRESLVGVGDYLLVLNSSRGTLTVLE